jgi:ribonuclease P protein component
MTARFGVGRRLRRRVEFDRVFQKGRRLDGRLFVLLALPNGASEDRLGLTVSRRIGGAVVRNRARRLLREGFRRCGREGCPGLDLVLLAKGDLVGRTQGEVERELNERLRRLEQASGRARKGRAGAPSGD